MKMRRASCLLSVLLLAALLCALAPAAFAEDACLCPSARDREPNCGCGCGGDLESMRTRALADFLDVTLAAEEAEDSAARAALYREAAQRWDSYMAIVLKSLEAAGNTAPEEATTGIIGGADGPTDIFLNDGRKAHDPYIRDRKHPSPVRPEGKEPGQTDLYLSAEDASDVYYTEPIIGGMIEIGMPNPWTETDSLEEALRISGVDVRLPAESELPQGMKLLWYRALPGTFEADYSDGKEELMLRASTDEEGYVLSGDYNTYSKEWNEKVGDVSVDCLGDGNRINVAMFKQGDTAYAITMACGREGYGLAAEEFSTLVKAMLSEDESADAVDIYADPVDIYADPKPVQSFSEMEKPEIVKNGEIMVLFTGDVRCGIDEGFGYAGLKTLRDSLDAQGYTTILVDGGNAVQGDMIGELSRGEAIIDFMNALDYNVAVPGEHETDYGEAQFMKLVRSADFPYISCNFALADGQALEPYVILDADGKKIAFIGVTMGENVKAVSEKLQAAVDSARSEGAEIVYVIGYADALSNVSAADIIPNTMGIDVFFDNSGAEPFMVSDKTGYGVVAASCGAKLSGIGYSRISATGAVVENGIWTWSNGPSAAMLFGIDNDITEMVEAARQKAEEELYAAKPEAAPAGEISYITLSDEDIAALEEMLDYLYFGSKRQ